eukprot:421175-Lingulodinium_polyedra.AAC.1
MLGCASRARFSCDPTERSSSLRPERGRAFGRRSLPPFGHERLRRNPRQALVLFGASPQRAAVSQSADAEAPSGP